MCVLLPDIPCVIFLLAESSAFKHPQDDVFPELRQNALTFIDLPQSHLQNHIVSVLFSLLPAYPMTDSLVNLNPVISLKFQTDGCLTSSISLSLKKLLRFMFK